MTAGRPLNYDDPKKLQDKIDEYFDQTDKPTISGMAIYAGFSDRYSFYEYEKRPKFTYTIKRARARMTEYYETNVFDHAAGSIFMLKNLGYSDKQTIDNTHHFKGKSPIVFGDTSSKDETKP